MIYEVTNKTLATFHVLYLISTAILHILNQILTIETSSRNPRFLATLLYVPFYDVCLGSIIKQLSRSANGKCESVLRYAAFADGGSY